MSSPAPSNPTPDPDEPVRQFLRARGSSQRVVSAGLEGLVREWESIVDQVSRGYDFTLDDYLNDMDLRQLLDQAMTQALPARRQQLQPLLQAADEKMRELLVPSSHCLWGEANARSNGWTAANNWWYFMRPRTAGPDLLHDLRRLHGGPPSGGRA